LALANRPTPSLSKFGKYPDDVRRNRATYDLYEPGSTFKVVTAAILLDRGAVTPTQRFYCENGEYRVADRRFHDHDRFQTLSFREIVQHSSNIGMIKASHKLSGPAMLEEFRRFGFGKTTGVCAAETAGSVPEDLAKGKAVTQASATIGYGISVTGIQMASAFATIANDGVRVSPRVVLGMRAPDGTWTPEPEPVRERIVSADTARTMTSILYGAVEHGTGTAARIPGYRVAGKTGTARKHYEDYGYSTTDHMASFGGYAPADDPGLVCLVVIDTPTRGGYYGGQAAAPVFRRIMVDALAYLRVPSDGTRTVMYPPPAETVEATPAAITSETRR
jgi:cell division protein FtsI (penicillin-binding protein 3)